MTRSSSSSPSILLAVPEFSRPRLGVSIGIPCRSLVVLSFSWFASRGAWLLSALAGFSLTAHPAHADEPHHSRSELDILASELEARSAAVDPKPEGKTISRIELVRLEVFDERDPMPDFVNVFHVTSRERVIRRELLFGAGERWLQSRVDETARNLKG